MCVCVCARPEPLQHLCIKMCSSLSQAPLTGWLRSSANAWGALEMASFGPPPAPFPSPPSRLYLICCHLRSKERARAPASSIMHGQLSSERALSGLPAPPIPAQPRAEGVGEGWGAGGRESGLLLKPWRLWSQTPCVPQKSLTRGRDANQNPQLSAGQVGWRGLCCLPYIFIFVVSLLKSNTGSLSKYPNIRRNLKIGSESPLTNSSSMPPGLLFSCV